MKKNFLRTVSAIALCLVLVLSLSACGGLSSEQEAALDSSISDLQDSLGKAFEKADSVDAMMDAITEYANSNQYYNLRVTDNVLVVVRQAASDSSQPDVTIQTSLSLDDPEGSAYRAETALAAFTNASDNRKITLIFTAADGFNYYGAREVPESYLETDNLISLNSRNENEYVSQSSGLNRYRFTRSATMESVSSSMKTYRISIQGLSGRLSPDGGYSSPNPVTEIYDILDYCVNNHLDYHINSLTTTGDAYNLPTGCELVLTIDPSNTTKFETKMQSEIEEYESDHRADEPDYTFTYEVISTVDTALSEADATDLLSMIYTVRDDFEYLDEDESGRDQADLRLMGVTVNSESMYVDVSSRTIDSSVESSINETFTGLAELNNFSCKKQTLSPSWSMDDQSTLWLMFRGCIGRAGASLSNSTTYGNLETGIFAQSNESLSQISFGVTSSHVESDAAALLLFLEAAGEDQFDTQT